MTSLWVRCVLLWFGGEFDIVFVNPLINLHNVLGIHVVVQGTLQFAIDLHVHVYMLLYVPANNRRVPQVVDLHV